MDRRNFLRTVGTAAAAAASSPLKAAYDGLEVYFPILPQV